jgi:hypothetical protein
MRCKSAVMGPRFGMKEVESLNGLNELNGAEGEGRAEAPPTYLTDLTNHSFNLLEKWLRFVKIVDPSCEGHAILCGTCIKIAKGDAVGFVS